MPTDKVSAKKLRLQQTIYMTKHIKQNQLISSTPLFTKCEHEAVYRLQGRSLKLRASLSPLKNKNTSLNSHTGKYLCRLSTMWFTLTRYWSTHTTHTSYRQTDLGMSTMTCTSPSLYQVYNPNHPCPNIYSIGNMNQMESSKSTQS